VAGAAQGGGVLRGVDVPGGDPEAQALEDVACLVFLEAGCASWSAAR
jgi:hypothetical protein